MKSIILFGIIHFAAGIAFCLLIREIAVTYREIKKLQKPKNQFKPWKHYY